ncbi:hypothetical protein [Metabacillus arenae]|uniref:Uncharacterized protein n=1 Tax=Metabacillus arenae TaxID=2771434 RepID=A0A926NDG9_9BACI|nr:hypothetical protein [Metabacillus arenae]MBD1379226.1 hypothetical protein [Metabacillus arenae]
MKRLYGVPAILLLASLFIFFGVWNDNLLIVLMSLVTIVITIVWNRNEQRDMSERQIKVINSKLNTIINELNLTKTHFFLDFNQQNALLIDEKQSKVAVFKNEDNNYQPYVYSFNEIVQSEIKEDDSTVTKVDRGSQVGGVVVGGALLGGAGAIIGGLSGSKRNTKGVKSIELILTCDDLIQPLHKITFLKSNDPLNVDNPIYKNLYDKALLWQNVFSVIIKRQQNNQSV